VRRVASLRPWRTIEATSDRSTPKSFSTASERPNSSRRALRSARQRLAQAIVAVHPCQNRCMNASRSSGMTAQPRGA
jgi:hypothetical protein